MRRGEDFLSPERFDVPGLLEEVSRLGAASAPLLREEARVRLLAEAAGYPYTPEPPVVGAGERTVRQEMASFEAFPAGSGFLTLAGAAQALFDRALSDIEPYPFRTPLRFDSLVLQRYPPGSLGITPHRDGLSNINLICIVVLEGAGRFYVCRDRAGNEPVEVEASPGQAVLLRAPGFMGSDRRPFHYLTGIEGTRYSFGLRQGRR